MISKTSGSNNLKLVIELVKIYLKPLTEKILLTVTKDDSKLLFEIYVSYPSNPNKEKMKDKNITTTHIIKIVDRAP
jgi:hypothetical protein